MKINWQPIDTCPTKVDVLLYQPYQDSGIMMVGNLERWEGKVSGNTSFWFNPSHCSGYSMECDLNEPTHWAHLPEPPL